MIIIVHFLRKSTLRIKINYWMLFNVIWFFKSMLQARFILNSFSYLLDMRWFKITLRHNDIFNSKKEVLRFKYIKILMLFFYYQMFFIFWIWISSFCWQFILLCVPRLLLSKNEHIKIIFRSLLSNRATIDVKNHSVFHHVSL